MFIIDYFFENARVCYNKTMQIVFCTLCFIIGACFGSFLCCQARRIHLRTTKIAKPSSKSRDDKLGARSVCLSCKYQLKWYDNLPILSWLFLRGRCRKCHQKIGLAEFLSELGAGLAFLGLSTTISVSTATPIVWASFIATLIFTTILVFLAIYDGLYGELPMVALMTSIALAIIVLALKEWSFLLSAPFSSELIWHPLLSVTVLGGLYLLLYLVSKGKWVGDGDWLLGTAIAIALFDPWLSLITLFFANFLACLIMAPSALKHKQHQIYFGPFLAIAFVIVISIAKYIGG